MSNLENPQINFDEILNDMEESTDLFQMADIIKNLGFTKDQVRFMNVIIVNGIRRYHEMLFPEP